MTIRDSCLRCLDHLGATVALRDFHRQHTKKDLIGLRHDIDHDIDLALELAYHEHTRGMHATYFLLHTEPYWNDPDFELKCRQFQAYGHEVALHVNVLTEWMNREVDVIEDHLRTLIEKIRNAGVDVVGVSAHGDKMCYQHGFINCWMWHELRTEDPAQAERGKSAEGVVVDDPEWQIPYPKNHHLTRNGGSTFPLWSVSMRELGIEYDGAHLNEDRYWTDSGGDWTRSGNPLEHNLSHGRHQVLIHPWWWKDERKTIFVLSAARSGSKWLAGFIDRATSATGLHEWTLNHVRAGDEYTPDKRTTQDFADLVENRPQASRRIRDAVVHHSLDPHITIEANVYLESFLPELVKIAPNAELIHLHRDGRDVVRSIVNRGWYDTPEDRRHRRVDIPEWDALNQFERCCWYWRSVQENIARHTHHRIPLERMVSDLPFLSDVLGALGVIVHPLLAEAVFGEKVNASKRTDFPAHPEWTHLQRATYQRICGKVHAALGYESAGVHEPDAPAREHSGDRQPRIVFDAVGRDIMSNGVTGKYVRAKARRDGLHCTTLRESRSAHIVLSKGSWAESQPGDSFPSSTASYGRVTLEAELTRGMAVRVFVLFFDDRGRQCAKHFGGTLRSDATTLKFTWNPPLSAEGFSLALHFGDQAPGDEIILKRVLVEAVPLAPNYAAMSP